MIHTASCLTLSQSIVYTATDSIYIYPAFLGRFLNSSTLSLHCSVAPCTVLSLTCSYSTLSSSLPLVSIVPPSPCNLGGYLVYTRLRSWHIDELFYIHLACLARACSPTDQSNPNPISPPELLVCVWKTCHLPVRWPLKNLTSKRCLGLYRFDITSFRVSFAHAPTNLHHCVLLCWHWATLASSRCCL